MKKGKIFLIIIVFLTVTLAIMAIFLSKKPTTENIIIPTIVEGPTIETVVVPTRMVENYSSETGAKYISPTDDEYKKEWLVNNLRSKTPIKNEYFEIDYNYQTDIFEIKNFKDEGIYFQKWLQDSGYSNIPNNRIKIIQ